MNLDSQPRSAEGKFKCYLTGNAAAFPGIPPGARPLIGVLEGTGIGAEVIAAALGVLEAVEQVSGIRFEVQRGGLIGEAAEAQLGQSLPEGTAAFCAEVFARGGAILSGPGGGRYVYDLRRRFDLFCKFVPVQPCGELVRPARLAIPNLPDLDLLLVRDNVGGVYQGQWQERVTPEGRVAEHTFRYRETEVERLVTVAARAAADRRGHLHVIIKNGGVPGISALWTDVGRAVARKHQITAVFMNIDLAAYELIRNPAQFDVLVAPNLFGDILADIAGILLGSRGVTFSGNFDSQGRGVYQTNHGCAHDLAGADVANPGGQILSLAMLLRESFGLNEGAALIERALSEAWRQGWRTADVAEPGCQVVGTRALADRVVQEILRRAEVARSA